LLHPPGPDIGKKIPLSKERYSVGRGSDADFTVARESVSRRHAEIHQDREGRWCVADLGSTNGTFVNEQRLTGSFPLKDGDQVRFGDAIYKFLMGSNIESAYHEEIYKMTIMDGLTGVHNKRSMLEFMERELASSQRHSRPLSLVMFDIDHFKKINDTRGHLCGDAVLKQLCGRLKPRIRREDLFARYGGEEFACVLTVTPLNGAVTFAEAVRTIIERELFNFDGTEFPVTVSLGVATMDNNPYFEATELIARADENLYKAKHAGRNRVIPNPADIIPII
jgi:diguanylate cyclase (GGDEF)-like protein